MFFKCCMCRVNSKDDSLLDDLDSNNDSINNIDYISKLEDKTQLDDSIIEDSFSYDTLSEEFYFWALVYLFSKDTFTSTKQANVSSTLNTGFIIKLYILFVN